MVTATCLTSGPLQHAPVDNASETGVTNRAAACPR